MEERKLVIWKSGDRTCWGGRRLGIWKGRDRAYGRVEIGYQILRSYLQHTPCHAMRSLGDFPPALPLMLSHICQHHAYLTEVENCRSMVCQCKLDAEVVPQHRVYTGTPCFDSFNLSCVDAEYSFGDNLRFAYMKDGGALPDAVLGHTLSVAQQHAAVEAKVQLHRRQRQKQ